MHRLSALLITVLAVHATTVPASAARINELFLATPGTPDTSVPNAIELAGLHGYDGAELALVILAAREGVFSDVRQVVHLPVTQPLHLLSDGDWPASIWSGALTGVGDETLLDLGEFTGGEQDRLNFDGTRQLRLYDGPTRLQPGHNVDDPLFEFRLDGAGLLDMLSFSNAGSTTPGDATATLHDGASIVQADGGWVLARPNDPETGVPAEDWLVGSPDAQGVLTGLEPYQVTPGRSNPAWAGPVAPEPSSLAAILLGAGAALLRPGRHGRGGITVPGCGAGRAHRAGRRRAR